MPGFAVAVVALLLYLWQRNAGVAVVVVVGLCALIMIGMAIAVGASLGHRNPPITRWVLWLWTPGIVLVVGAATAAIAQLATVAVAGDDASDVEATTAALIAAVLAAAGTQLTGWLPGHLAPWFSVKVIWLRYRPYFPEPPDGMPLGFDAWQALTNARRDVQTGPDVQALLETIKAAIEAGQTRQHPDWKHAETGFD